MFFSKMERLIMVIIFIITFALGLLFLFSKEDNYKKFGVIFGIWNIVWVLSVVIYGIATRK